VEEGEIGRPRKHSTEQKSSSMGSTKVHVSETHCGARFIREEKSEKEEEEETGKWRSQNELLLCPALLSFKSDRRIAINVLC